MSLSVFPPLRVVGFDTCKVEKGGMGGGGNATAIFCLPALYEGKRREGDRRPRPQRKWKSVVFCI